MLSKSLVSYIQSLSQKKYRQKYQCFVAEGNKICTELLTSNWGIEHVLVTQKFETTNKQLLSRNEKQLIIIEDFEMEKISSSVTPQEILIVAKIKAQQSDAKIEDWAIALDGIQDPGNLGTIIRTADWYGIAQIFCSPDCADVYNSKVIQSTMGSFMRVDVNYVELEDWLQKNSTLPVFGAVLNGKKMNEIKFPTKGILLLGNESKGIRLPLQNLITEPITISSFGGAESLNVAVATGIICNQVKQS